MSRWWRLSRPGGSRPDSRGGSGSASATCPGLWDGGGLSQDTEDRRLLQSGRIQRNYRVSLKTTHPMSKLRITRY